MKKILRKNLITTFLILAALCLSMYLIKPQVQLFGTPGKRWYSMEMNSTCFYAGHSRYRNPAGPTTPSQEIKIFDLAFFWYVLEDSEAEDESILVCTIPYWFPSTLFLLSALLAATPYFRRQPPAFPITPDAAAEKAAP